MNCVVSGSFSCDCVLFLFFLIRTSNAEGCNWPGYPYAVRDVAVQMPRDGRRDWVQERRRCLRLMTGTFTNEEMLHISVEMQPYITSRWWWVTGPFLVDFIDNWWWKWHFTKYHRFDWKTSYCQSFFTTLSGRHWRRWHEKPGSERWNLSFEYFKEALIAHESVVCLIHVKHMYEQTLMRITAHLVSSIRSHQPGWPHDM